MDEGGEERRGEESTKEGGEGWSFRGGEGGIHIVEMYVLLAWH
jgi:hypothetical protein